MHYCGPRDVPAADITLRAIDDARVDVVLEGEGRVVESVELGAAFFQV